MDCPDCGSDTLAFVVPEQYRDALRGDTASYNFVEIFGTTGCRNSPGNYSRQYEQSGVAICTHCLTLHPAPAAPAKIPDFQRLSDAFPSNREAAVPMVLVVGLLSNLALYRAEISDLLAVVERAGTDPLLVLDRLDRDPDIDPATDLAGRRRQLEQLL